MESSKIITTKTESQDASTTISIDIWQKIVKSQRKKKKPESATSTTKWDILQRITGQNKR